VHSEAESKLRRSQWTPPRRFNGCSFRISSGKTSILCICFSLLFFTCVPSFVCSLKILSSSKFASGVFVIKEFKEKYEIVQEMQQSMNFFPPKKLVTMWLNSGILTGENPQRMRRRRLMPETGLPPEPGEGYEVVADDDFNSDNEVRI